MKRKIKLNKPTSYRTGLWAEGVARLVFRLKGYRILASRYKTPMGEIDIVAARGKIVAFAEVKARGDIVTASLAVTPSQRSRIERAAAAFLSRHPAFFRHDMRFDVLLIRPFHWPVHILDAWRPPFR
jgi:putative endonuclease